MTSTPRWGCGGAPADLEERYEAARRTPSDIHEHLAVLRGLAQECEHVTEFGVRWANGSTVALLAGQPAELVSWDVQPGAIISQAVADLVGMAGRTRFQPRVGDTLGITIEPTDLLFIDTLHTAQQLKAELTRHGTRVRRYLVFHDTTTYGRRGEDGTEPGIRAAIYWFVKQHQFPLWLATHEYPENNGLIVLTRDPDVPWRETA